MTEEQVKALKQKFRNQGREDLLGELIEICEGTPLTAIWKALFEAMQENMDLRSENARQEEV